MNRSIALGNLGRQEAEIAVYDELERRFADATELELRERVAWALFNRAIALGELGYWEKELAAHDDLDRRFGRARAGRRGHRRRGSRTFVSLSRRRCSNEAFG